MDPFVTVIVYLLGSIGLVQVIVWAACRLARPAQGSRSYHVIPLERDPGRLEAQLRYELLALRWSLSDRWMPLFLLDTGLEPEALAVCERMLRGVGGVWLCAPEELPGLIARADDCQYGEDGI